MTGRLWELRKYIAMTELDDVDEEKLHFEYQKVRNLFLGYPLMMEAIDEFNSAYNTMVSAEGLVGKARFNLLKKLEEIKNAD